MAIELYSWPRSSGTRVCWALEELGVPYRYVEIDPKQKQQLTPAYLAVNPHGKVPALVDDGQRFFESVAILLHLAHKYAVERGLWPAAGSPQRADALSWLVWSGTELGPRMLDYIYHGMDSPVSYRPQDRSAAAAGYDRSELDRMLRTLEAQLDGRDALVGGAFSLADLACSSALAFGTSLGLALGDHPRTAAWLERCTARPARARAR